MHQSIIEPIERQERFIAHLSDLKTQLLRPSRVRKRFRNLPEHERLKFATAISTVLAMNRKAELLGIV